MVGIGESGRTRRDVSRQKNEADVSVSGTERQKGTKTKLRWSAKPSGSGLVKK